MKPIEIILPHLERLHCLYGEKKSWLKMYDFVCDEIPAFREIKATTLKQYTPMLIEITAGVNDELSKVKQELEAVKQELSELQRLNMDKQSKPEPKAGVTEKRGINISGWSIQKSGGFYRGFRKISGRTHGVYLGRTLDDAELKIQRKEAALR